MTVSPRRICRNTEPRWIPAAFSHAPSARTAHLFSARANGPSPWVAVPSRKVGLGPRPLAIGSARSKVRKPCAAARCNQPFGSLRVYISGGHWPVRHFPVVT